MSAKTRNTLWKVNWILMGGIMAMCGALVESRLWSFLLMMGGGITMMVFPMLAEQRYWKHMPLEEKAKIYFDTYQPQMDEMVTRFGAENVRLMLTLAETKTCGK